MVFGIALLQGQPVIHAKKIAAVGIDKHMTVSFSGKHAAFLADGPAPDSLYEVFCVLVRLLLRGSPRIGAEDINPVTEDHTLAFYDSGANLISRSSYDEPADFVKLMDGYALAADSGEPRVRVMRLDGHSDTQIFSYEADYVHQEARVSGDGNLLMLFGYEGFRIYYRDGNMTAQHELQEAEQIYDQQYIRSQEASYLEVTWKDGMVRQYGMDGRLRMEEKHEAPDQSLTEEFVTDRYRIVSRLNEPLEVYDRKTGRLAAQLDQDANLTYVTQLDGYIMMEYVSTELERYGILLNEDLEQLAELPGLCDVYGDTVVFDYQNGTISSSSIYLQSSGLR